MIDVLDEASVHVLDKHVRHIANIEREFPAFNASTATVDFATMADRVPQMEHDLTLVR